MIDENKDVRWIQRFANFQRAFSQLTKFIDKAELSELEEAFLYGSRAKGTFKPGSDIDLTLIGKGLTLMVLNKISLALDDLLLPYTFDLSLFNHIKQPDLIDHIRRVGKMFYTKNE